VKTEPRIGVGVIVRRGAEVLLIRRKNVHGSGTWSTPGGHLDYGESPETCAVRETMEETGVVVSNLRFRAITNDIFEAEGRHYITIWMEGEHQEGDALVKAEHEMSDVGWFRWDGLPRPLFLSLENLLMGRCYPPPESASGPVPGTRT
jgi:8-oxo-dGTP diphosphatase